MHLKTNGSGWKQVVLSLDLLHGDRVNQMETCHKIVYLPVSMVQICSGMTPNVMCATVITAVDTTISVKNRTYHN